MNTNTQSDALSAWLKRDEKTLLKGIKDGMDMFELAFDLEREPLSVLRHICEDDGPFECEMGSDEQVEFFGLALSGVPLDQAILWCDADKDRPDDIESLMKIGDMRPALHFARDFGVCMANADAMDDLCWIMSQPAKAIAAAIKSIGHRFDIVTTQTLKDHLTGVSKGLSKDDVFPPAIKQSCGTWARKGRKTTTTTTTATRYRKKSTASSSGWKRKRFSGRRKAA